MEETKINLGLEQPQKSFRSKLRSMNKNDMRLIHNYGCWCSFDTYKKTGSYGQPVDFFDRACKTLKEGYECIEMDAEKEDDFCDIEGTSYRSAVGGGMPGSMTLEVLQAECEQVNESNCQQRLCTVEGWFIQQLLKRTYSEGIFPEVHKYRHSSGNFDHGEQCQRGNGGGSKPEAECCGKYPLRFSYKLNGNVRGCCAGKTFNNVLMSCCEDGSIKPIC